MTRQELRDQWAARLTAFKDSGQNISEWCASHNVSVQQLRCWLKKEKKTQTRDYATKWLPMEIIHLDATPKSSLMIKIGQISIEVKPGFDPTLLLDVVNVLGASYAK